MSQPNPKSSAVPVRVRPSARLLKPWYYVSFILIALVFGYTNNTRQENMQYLFVLPALLLAFVAWKHFQLRFDTITLTGNKLRQETGMFSKATRTLELSKVQDVRVEQSLFDRMLGLGTITIETAGDSAPLVMKGVEAPQQVADYILEAAHR